MLSKDLFYYLSQFIDISTFSKLGRVNKEYNRFYKLLIAKVYYEKNGNFNYAYSHAPAYIIDYMCEHHPYIIEIAELWRRYYYIDKRPKIMLKTAILSNNYDLIMMHKTIIMLNQDKAFKYFNAYSSYEVSSRVLKACDLSEKFHLYLNILMKKFTKENLPYHFLVRYGYCNDFMRIMGNMHFTGEVLCKSLYYAAKTGRDDIFIKLLHIQFNFGEAMIKLLRKRYFKYVRIILRTCFISTDMIKIILLYGEKSLYKESYGISKYEINIR